jgi:hypothetical protein
MPRQYGPKAASNRAMLPNDHYRELFDWVTDQLLAEEGACFFGGLIQAVACARPDLTYWQAAAAVQEISQRPDFNKLRHAAAEEAGESLKQQSN